MTAQGAFVAARSRRRRDNLSVQASSKAAAVHLAIFVKNCWGPLSGIANPMEGHRKTRPNERQKGAKCKLSNRQQLVNALGKAAGEELAEKAKNEALEPAEKETLQAR